MNKSAILQKPCEPMLKISEEFKSTEVDVFLDRKKVEALMGDVKAKLYAIVDGKENGFTNEEVARFEHCLGALKELLKETLNDKIKEAVSANIKGEETVKANVVKMDKEIDKFDDLLKNL
ncbi:MAG: hypothetical protein AB7S44_02230 [Spirochaetales bacterium]